MEFSIPKKLLPLIAELRALATENHDDHTNIKNVSAILKPWILQHDWLEEKYYQVDPRKGFSSWLLHEEDDHRLAINLVSWQPRCEIVPHDHKTWGVVGNIVGVEKNYFWIRKDDGSIPGYAEIERTAGKIFGQDGELVTFLPDDIHSVANETNEVAISLHVYGKNLNYTGRNQYDPIKKTVRPFIIEFS